MHTHNPKSGVLGRVAARMARVPVVVNTVHGLYANPALPRVRRTLISAAERGAFRVSDHELFQSREDFEWAVGRRLVPRSRATWLGNGVDLGRFDPAAVDVEAVAVVRKGWGAEDGTVVAVVRGGRARPGGDGGPRLCAEAGLVRVGMVALDGKRVKADAAMSANKTRAGIEEEVRAILAEAAEIDAAEDRALGDARGDELP